MSGPKTAVYMPTNEQTRLIMEKHQKKLILTRFALIKDELAAMSSLDNERHIADELIIRGLSDNGFTASHKSLMSEIGEAEKYISSMDSNSSIGELMKSEQIINGLMKNIRKHLYSLKKTDIRNRTALNGFIYSNLSENSKLDFSIKSKKKEELEALRDEIFDDIQNIQNPLLSEDLKTQIDSALARLVTINDTAFLKTFRSVTVASLINRCNTYSEEIKKHELENIEKEKQSYVFGCIEEVMEDMGYNLIGRKNRTAVRSELYSFADGTAVDVSYTDDGRITMELGGVACESRNPDDYEAEVLLGYMNSLCGEYAEFERRLLEKGVVPKSVSQLPLQKKYARIIDISDYDINDGEVELFVTSEYTTKNNIRRAVNE